MAIHKLHIYLIGLSAAQLVVVCAGPAMLRAPMPAALVTSSPIPGYSHIRYWGDDAAAIDTRMVDLPSNSGNPAT